MAYYKCGAGIESGKSFIPVDPKGTKNRRWVCSECASLIQKQQTRNILGRDLVNLLQDVDSKFLK